MRVDARVAREVASREVDARVVEWVNDGVEVDLVRWFVGFIHIEVVCQAGSGFSL